MTKGMSALLCDAITAGYSVGRDGSAIVVFKMVKHNQYKVTAEGLMIYENGTGIRLNQNLNTALGLRSFKDMRAVLGLA